jgi:hypothetical protein
VEAVENEEPLVFGDAYTGVRDGQFCAVVVLVNPGGYSPAVRRVLHGVAQRYGGDLEDASPIEGGHDLLVGG